MIFLTDKEYTMIDKWRSINVSSPCSPQFATSLDLLKTWSDAKEQYLYKMLGNKTILTKKNISYNKSIPAIRKELEKNPRIRAFVRYLERKVADALNCTPYWKLPVMSLFTFHAITENKNEQETFTVEINNKIIKISKNEKIIKIYRKLLNAIDTSDNKNIFEEFEYFRIFVSQVINNKQTSGDFCLSIHPLDFMTMSDNSCNWSSCMSWANSGEFRLGTTTMLNSPCVIMGYIKSSKNDFYIENDAPWSNKKWRCLFVVTKEAIISIKDYPDHYTEIKEMFVNWIADLAKQNLDWEYDFTLFYRRKGDQIEDKNGNLARITVNLVADIMYNDYHLDEHIHRFNSELLESYYDSSKESKYLEIIYSGPHQCMTCGETYFNYYNITDTLECLDCNLNYNPVYCEDCGQLLDPEDENTYWVESENGYFCSYCFRTNFLTCSLCYEPYRRREGNFPISVYIINPDDIILDENNEYYLKEIVHHNSLEVVCSCCAQNNPNIETNIMECYLMKQLYKEEENEKLKYYIVSKNETRFPKFYFPSNKHTKIIPIKI